MALRVYDTSQLRPETVTRRATNFILRYVDWRLEEVRPQWRHRESWIYCTASFTLFHNESTCLLRLYTRTERGTI